METARPKKGDYLMFFYHGLIGGITSVMRVIDITKTHEMRIHSVVNQTDTELLFPPSYSFDLIEPKPTKFCFVPISESEVKSLVMDKDLNDIISEISVYRDVPFNDIKKWRLETLLDDFCLVRNYTKDLHKNESFKLYRVWDNGVKIYDPLEKSIK